MSSYGATERTAQEEANKVIEWFLADHEMRAVRCEQDVLKILRTNITPGWQNSRLIQAEEARELAKRIRREIGIVDLRTKCQCLADTETRMTIRVRERIAAGESNQRMDCFKRKVLFPIREAFLSCSAALHVSRGGDDSDLGQFSTLIREFMPNRQAFQGDVVDQWMAVMTNALIKARIFPSMESNGEKRRKGTKRRKAKKRRNGSA